MAGGRPRTTSLEPDDMIALGKEMVDWVKKNNPLHLSYWYLRVKKIIFKDWRIYRERPEFTPYYEEALSIVGENYINGTVDKSIAQRFLRIYFKDLKEEEDSTAKYNADLKANEAQQYSQEDIDRAQRILEQVSRNQASARKIASNNVKADDKS